MTLKAEDFIGPPCDCVPCRQADVSDREIRRDPSTGRWLHGMDLWRWYEARDQARKLFPSMTKGWPETTGASAGRRAR